MPLYKWIRSYIEKFSFVTRTEFKNAQLYIFYLRDGKETFRKLPYRANKQELLETLDKIREDINYWENVARIAPKILNRTQPLFKLI